MKNWGNWTYDALARVVATAQKENRATIGIDQEHTDYHNDRDVQEWLTAMGLKFDSQMERTVIYLR